MFLVVVWFVLLCFYALKLISCFLVINKIVPRQHFGLFSTAAKLYTEFLAWSCLVTMRNLPNNYQTQSEDEHELGTTYNRYFGCKPSGLEVKKN